MKIVTKVFFLLTITLFTPIFSEDRIEVNSRPLSASEIKDIMQKRKIELKNDGCQNEFNTKNPYYQFLVFNTSTHNVVKTTSDTLIIEDGSEWKIKQGQEKEVSSWNAKDPILIVLNDSFSSYFFSHYKYKMINAEKNTSVEVKLFLGPVLNNPKTLKIVSIDYTTNELILSDATFWKCDISDHLIFDKWISGDGIIIGSNTKGYFFNRKYDNFLINVNMLQEIKANRLK